MINSLSVIFIRLMTPRSAFIKACRLLRSEAFYLSFAFLLTPAAHCQAPPDLKFDTLPIGTTEQVVFTTFFSTAVQPGSAAAQEQFSYRTDNGKYVIFVDPDTIAPIPRYNAFVFDASIKREGSGAANWYVYHVRAEPHGKFPDSLAKINFKITAGTEESVGSINLPVHSSAYDGDLLRKLGNSPTLDVRVSDSDGPSIILQNNLENLDIRINKVSVKGGCYRCWEQVKLPDAASVIHHSDTTSIQLNIKPRSLNAMLTTAFILAKEKPQDLLSVTIEYSVDQGGMPKEKTFDVPVRFTPSIWLLAIAVLCGGFVGAILKRLLDHEVNKITLKLMGQIILLAVVAEFIAVLAASFDSKVIILGFDLDPRQLIPAAVLAFGVTGGPTVTKWASSIIRLGSNAPGNP